MATLYKPKQQQALYGQGNGSLAAIYEPADYGEYINVTEDFPWTISYNVKKQAGRVILKEYEINESTMKRQALFYLNGANQFIQGLTPSNRPANAPQIPALQGINSSNYPNYLKVYEDLYPKDKPTRFTYDFPYFDEINFQVTTPQWASLDTVEQLMSKGAQTGKPVLDEVTKFLEGVGAGAVAGAVKTVGDLAGKAVGFGAAAGAAALGFLYPKVGILDRPRIWETHYFRDINISVPLYNTLAPDDWKLNRQLCELLVNQNLYNKRDFVTGVPPVFYEVLVVGQHYSWASCMTNISIYNRGNIRILQKDDGSKCNVPDVYEINLTLTDLVVPSKNQFQSMNDPAVTSRLVNGIAGLETNENGLTQDLDNAARQAVRGAAQVLPQTFQPQSQPCWVAREIYGINNIKWVIFRSWLYGDSGPKWLQTIYTKFGKQFANWISNKPFIKKVIKYIMDQIIRNYETK